MTAAIVILALIAAMLYALTGCAFALVLHVIDRVVGAPPTLRCMTDSDDALMSITLWPVALVVMVAASLAERRSQQERGQ